MAGWPTRHEKLEKLIFLIENINIFLIENINHCTYVGTLTTSQ